MSNMNQNLLNLNEETLNGQTSITDLKNATESEVEKFTKSYKEALRKDPEVLKLIKEVEITNPKSILNFGEKTTLEINTIADNILKNLKSVNEEDTGEMLNQLSKIMDRFNKQEIKKIISNKKPNMFQKLISKAKHNIEEIIEKYNSMMSEVDKIYMLLKKYEVDIENNSDILSKLYNANVNQYNILEKYIVAGELILEELNNKIIPLYEKRKDELNDGRSINDYNIIMQCKTMMEERVYDLRLAEQVALQNMPMIQQMEMGNFELTKTIKSAFIITLPVLKQCLINAVILKKRELQSQGIKALQNVTNELLVKNAQNTAKQNVEMAKMNGDGSISIEALEEAYNAIIQGIEQTKRQQIENQKKRDAGEKKLEELKYKTLTQKDTTTNIGEDASSTLLDLQNGQTGLRL